MARARPLDRVSKRASDVRVIGEYDAIADAIDAMRVLTGPF